MVGGVVCVLIFQLACIFPLEGFQWGEGGIFPRGVNPHSYNPLSSLSNLPMRLSNLFTFHGKAPTNEESTSKAPHAYYSSGSSGNKNKDDGWPLTEVNFTHPIQSPVDLITSKAITKQLPMLDIIEPDMEGVMAKFYNSGHTVYVYIKEDPKVRPYLTGGPLKQKFIFEQMHFHWGSEDIWGSEHFIDGESFAVEIHMVHYNSKYGSFEEAATKKDGLAVLTAFAEANSEDNPLLEPLHQHLCNISEPKSFVMLDCMQAMQWAASSLSTNHEYFAYPGSLTTKPYTENVIFILIPKPITLSFAQLAAFRELHDDVEGLIIDNKRKLQPLHNRPIVRSTSLQ